MWDLQIHKTEIVQQISWEQKSPQEVLNSAIEQQRQTIIEWMKKSLLKAWVSQERIQVLKFDVIWDIWIAINSKWEPNSLYKYSKLNWSEFYLNISWLEKDLDILTFWEKHSWYDLKNWKLFRNWKEISQFLWNEKINPNFVKWVDNLNFYSEMQNTFWLMKGLMNWEKIEFDVESFYISIVSWVPRIKDIMYFAWKGYIKNDVVLKLLKRAIQELPNQCSDTRFYQTAQWIRMWMEVTKDELDQYLKPVEWEPLITQSMYDDCLKRIELRDKKIAEMNWVKEESKANIKIEWTRNSFIDKIKGILER